MQLRLSTHELPTTVDNAKDSRRTSIPAQLELQNKL